MWDLPALPTPPPQTSSHKLPGVHHKLPGRKSTSRGPACLIRSPSAPTLAPEKQQSVAVASPQGLARLYLLPWCQPLTGQALLRLHRFFQCLPCTGQSLLWLHWGVHRSLVLAGQSLFELHHGPERGARAVEPSSKHTH